MKAELAQKLIELSLEEKNEVFIFLMPYVTPPHEEDEISPELMAELERRFAEHRADPSGSITLEDFKSRRFSVQ